MANISPFAKRTGRGRKRAAPRLDWINNHSIINLSLLTFLIVYALPSDIMEKVKPSPFASAPGADGHSGSFGLCGYAIRYNCVIDGDTFYYRGEKIRVLGIDTPETHPPRCAREERLGTQATFRLQQLLNAGPFSLREGMRDEDVYGRKLRSVMRSGRNLGDQMIAEGYARSYGSGRRPWC
jgi:micrococcal nuclease